ncbi:hypothetical protein QOZ95_005052 [Paenibacillus brasilensis]|uniref:Uncharacterized protein n=1 Tax=Paenibacillus brasilensis TaxID=128574 RepID=A0ABU0L6F3_9BACL|nr:hypothetical protein [Paenibacillus brasilensis]
MMIIARTGACWACNQTHNSGVTQSNVRQNEVQPRYDVTPSGAVTVPKSTCYRLARTLLETVQGRAEHGLRSYCMLWWQTGNRNRNQSEQSNQ